MNRVKEIWLDKSNKKILVEWNPCNCHPNDLLMVWGRGFRQAATYPNQNKSVWTKRLMKRGWKRISREVIK